MKIFKGRKSKRNKSNTKVWFSMFGQCPRLEKRLLKAKQELEAINKVA